MSTMGVVLVGIAIVFVCMIIITVILSVFPYISGSEKKKKEKQEALAIKAAGPVPAENVVQTSANAESENETLIAVITAAVAAYLGDSQNEGFRVVSFKRIGDNASVWAQIGRLENLTD